MSSVDARSRGNRPRRGRLSKGDRGSLRVRVPRNLAVLFLQDATRAGISQSDQMAEILAMYYASSCRDPQPAEPVQQRDRLLDHPAVHAQAGAMPGAAAGDHRVMPLSRTCWRYLSWS